LWLAVLNYDGISLFISIGDGNTDHTIVACKPYCITKRIVLPSLSFAQWPLATFQRSVTYLSYGVTAAALQPHNVAANVAATIFSWRHGMYVSL